jgi:LmbE family N-acetylglucosaminyl deacetylase
MRYKFSLCRNLALALGFLSVSSGIWPLRASESNQKINVLVIFAHPDEGEIYAGGIAAIYSRLGHNVKFLSLTNGDAGHWSMNPDSLAKRRYREAMHARQILGLADYEILDYHDGKLKNSAEIQKIVAGRIEKWKSDLVLLYYPIVNEPGGHNDNMQAGLIVHDAASLIKMEKQPAYLYMRDYFTTGFSHIPDIAFNIEEVWDTKLLAMKAHESQVVEANPHADGILDEVLKSETKHQRALNGLKPLNLLRLAGKLIIRQLLNCFQCFRKHILYLVAQSGWILALIW